MKEESNRLWWAENGRAILSQLLVKSDKDPQVQKHVPKLLYENLHFCG